MYLTQYLTSTYSKNINIIYYTSIRCYAWEIPLCISIAIKCWMENASLYDYDLNACWNSFIIIIFIFVELPIRYYVYICFSTVQINYFNKLILTSYQLCFMSDVWAFNRLNKAPRSANQQINPIWSLPFRLSNVGFCSAAALLLVNSHDILYT